MVAKATTKRKQSSLLLFLGIATAIACITSYLLSSHVKQENVAVLGPLKSKSFLATSTSESSEMLACLRSVLNNLPIGRGRYMMRKKNHLKDTHSLVVFAHHYDAGTGKWNADIRLEDMPILEQQQKLGKCSVWEVGAYTTAGDSAILLKKYPGCQYHAYEPIPAYFNKLKSKWQNVARFTPHNYGIGPADSKFAVDREALKSQSTYIGDAQSSSEHEDVQNKTTPTNQVWAHVKSFEACVKEAGGHYPTLLHLNCEGCEWELIPYVAQSGIAAKIPILQIGTHNYGEVGLGNRAWQLCEIHSMLNRTHTMVKGVPFGWERWIIRK
jgi:FkbM family methyltransferase